MNRSIRRRATRVALYVLTCSLLGSLPQSAKAAVSNPPLSTKTNVLLIAIDDMGFGTTGAEGSTVPEITPNIDRLATEGKLFTRGYIMTPICGPSRAAILSGRYPHNSGMMGHGKQPPEDWIPPETITPTISKFLREKGYFTAAILKHKRNKKWNTWDVSYVESAYGVGHHDRSPQAFLNRTKNAILEAREARKPFFIYANPIDPHMPWPRTGWEDEALKTWNPYNPYPEPGRRYTAEEIEVPSHLPDLTGVREKLVPYYESLRRGDECVGGILEALKITGAEENTLVLFLSDHGMGTIGAKAMLYHHGVRTPVIIKWPGKVEPGQIDRESILSSVDIFPTVLEALGEPPIDALDGKSFLPVALGERERSERKYAYAAHNYYGDSTEHWYFPQRTIIDGDFSYIWNAYVTQPNGNRPFLPNGWKGVIEDYLTDEHPEIVAKIDSIVNKAPEELFDLRKDPGSWNNLVDDPKYADVLKRYRAKLKAEMIASKDPQLKFWKH